MGPPSPGPSGSTGGNRRIGGRLGVRGPVAGQAAGGGRAPGRAGTARGNPARRSVLLGRGGRPDRSGREQIGYDAPADLRQRLDQARRDIDLAARLDAIRLQRATLVEGRFNPAAERRFNNARADRDYKKAFREGGWGEIEKDPEAVAARVATSVARGVLVSAFGDWAVCATDASQRAWVLGVARRADPDAWRDRVRDPAAWDDPAALAALARVAPVAGQPVNLLVAFGERIQDTGGDGTAVLARVRQEHPHDFWAALALARALQSGTDPKAAVAPYRRALELRGDAAAIYSNLGLIPYAQRRWDDAIGYFQKALEIDPRFAPAHNHLGLAWKGEGTWTQAVHHFREAVRLDPELAPAHYNLGEIRAYSGGLDEAVDHYRQALRIDPGFARAEYLLGVALVAKGRQDEVNDRRREDLRTGPADASVHVVIFGLAQREWVEHYQQAYWFDPKFSVSHNNLALLPRDAGRLDEAIGHYERALRINAGVDPWLDRVHASLGQALLRAGAVRRGRGRDPPQPRPDPPGS